MKVMPVTRSGRSRFNNQEQPTRSQNFSFTSPVPPSNLDPNNLDAPTLEETFDNSTSVPMEAQDN